ncbi:DUF2188 domain-containing protein [Arthrobacter sp. I2-34]|uniref:DUF2188 domain-containing protein n=1 Tax=Arthrobacter hankyongi TaxID=2904801 RepID=A0ABS9LED6_9MICC|nr:DUF2188 domain-containing protein [Arthrobacter hankyongi]MCG2624888.1 DUF2188 domain-containing protein [Arthrobacter hankyongi]
MPAESIETYWEAGHWLNRIKGQDKVISTCGSRDVAIELGRLAARHHGVKHVVRRQGKNPGPTCESVPED